MSRSVDLFIASPDPLETVAQTIAALTGLTVTPGEDGSWVVQEGDVHAVLGEHGHPDEVELPLSRYPYALSARVPDSVRPQDSPAAALVRRVAQKLQEKSGWILLMVLDLQYRGTVAGREATANPEVPA
jgi:hypothetical protein